MLASCSGQGPQGEQGLQGAMGATGATGLTGMTGMTGMTGPSVTPGIAGAACTTTSGTFNCTGIAGVSASPNTSLSCAVSGTNLTSGDGCNGSPTTTTSDGSGVYNVGGTCGAGIACNSGELVAVTILCSTTLPDGGDLYSSNINYFTCT